MSSVVFILILLTIVLNTIGQLALKAGMIAIGYFDFTWNNIIPILSKVLFSPWIIIGIIIYTVSIFTWLMVLSRTQVCIAYPLSSIGYIVTAVAAYCLWDEYLSLTKILGILVILIGVYLIAKQ